MNERLVVHASEIILTLAGLFGIVIILLAAWYDLRSIAQKKQSSSGNESPSQRQMPPYATSSIRALPHIFNQLNRTIFKKAFAWRRSDNDKKNTQPHTPNHYLTSSIIYCIGLITFVGLSTYFFYTAATLQSNTLLMLSWIAVSLWLVAIIWSNDALTASKKIELTFTAPFMYFVFYVQAVISLLIAVRQIVMRIQPKAYLQSIYRAIQVELYSTRY